MQNIKEKTVTTDRKTMRAALPDHGRARRIPIYMPARLRQNGKTPVRVIVRHIALDSFSCRMAASLPVGTPCWLHPPRMTPMAATVSWTDGLIMNCTLDRPLAPALLDQLAQTYSLRD